MDSINWAGLLHAGMQMGLSPAQIWDLTPWEAQSILSDTQSRLGMTRGGLNELIAKYPDGKSVHNKKENDHD